MLDTVLLVDRLVLAGLFAVAGIAKLLDRHATRSAFEAFGIPVLLARPLAVAIPAAELVISAALLPQTTAWWAALAALLLLTAFSAGVAANLLAGRAPDCNCFGQVRPQPVSRRTLVRNLAFLLSAAAVVWLGVDHAGPSAIAWLFQMNASETALAVLSALLLAGVLLLAYRVRSLTAEQKALRDTVTILEHLFDQQEAAGRRGDIAPVSTTAPVPTLEVGSLAPDFALELPDRGMVGPLDLVLEGKAIVLVFVSRHCGPCRDLLPKMEQWAQTSSLPLTLLVVVAGSVHENTDLTAEFPGLRFAMSGNQPVADRLGAKWTPAAVALDAHSHVREAAVFGGEAVLQMLDKMAETFPNGAPRGEPVPPFTAVLASGQRVESDAFRTAAGTALLYWRESCPFCAALSADLRHWAAHRPPLSPELVLLVRDEADAPERFGAAMVVDKEGALMAQLDLAGTPSAVFVDARGVVAPFRMGGPPQIRSLLGIPPHAPATPAP